MRRLATITRRVAYGLLGLVVFVASVLVSVELALHTARGRELLRTQVDKLVSDALSARFEIDALDHASLFYLRGKGLRLSRGRERIVSCERFAIRLNPFALLKKQIAVHAAWLERPYLDLGASPEQGGGGLLGLLAEKQTQTEPARAPTQSGGLAFVFDGLRVSAGQLDLPLSGAQISLSRINLQAGLAIGDQLSGRVGFITFEVARDGETVGSLRGSQLHYGGGRLGGRLRAHTRHGELVAAGALGKPGAFGAREVEAQLYAHGITPADLERLGADVAWLKSPLELSVEARGTTRGGDFTLQLGTDGGHVHLNGRLLEGDHFSATLESRELDLSRVLQSGGERLAATITIDGKFAHDFSALELELQLRRGRYRDAPLPDTEIKGAYDSEHGLALEQLRARIPEAQAELRAQAHLPADGGLSVTVSLHAGQLERAALLHEFVPQLAGALDARATLRRVGGGELTAQLELAAKKLALSGVTSETLSVKARGAGRELATLAMTGEIHASALKLARMRFEQADLFLRADPRCYIAKARFGRQGQLDLRVDRVGNAYVARGDGDVALGHEQRLRLVIANARYAEQRLELGRAELTVGEASLRLEGRVMLEPQGRMQARAELSVPDLEPLAALFTSEHVAGKVELHARATGPTRKPRVTIDSRYQGDRVFGLGKADLMLHALIDVAQRTLDVSARADAKKTDVKLALHSELARAELSQAAFERGKYDVTVDIGKFPLSDFSLFPSGKLRLASADLSGHFHAQGDLRDPSVELQAQTRMRFHGDRDSMQLSVQAKYDDSHAKLELAASDAQGQLFHSAIDSDLEPHGPLARSFDDLGNLLSQRSWNAELWLRARRVDELPAVHAVAIQPALFPWRLSARAKLAHKPGEEPEGELELLALFDPSREPLHAARCGAAGAPKLNVKVKMADGTLSSKTEIEVANTEMVDIDTRSPAPLGKWLGPSTPEPLNLVARFDRLRFAALPVLCDELDGELSGQIVLDRAVTQAVTLKTELHAKNVAWGAAPKFDAYVEAHADRDDLRAKVDLNGAGGAATLIAKLPLDVKARVPMLRMDAPAQIELRLQEMSVQSLLGGVPEVSADSGKVDGEVKLDGSLSDPSLHGGLALRNVSVTLGKLGQRFEDVTGKLVLDGHRLRLAETHIHDRGGRLVVSGELDLPRRDSLRAQLKAKADKYPLRRDGVVLGAITGDIQLRADVAPKRTTLDIALRNAAVDLQGDDFGNVQSLKPNPEVHFLDTPPANIAPASDEDSETVIHIDASEPMWVRREDFAIQVSTRMTVVSHGETPEITGTLKIERGTIELLGQIFDIDRGSIEFSGGHEVEPTLDLTAKRNLPGGGSVTVQAEGRLTEPQLSFMVDDKPAPAEQALAALSGSGAGSASMQDQVGSVATGLAAGVLTMGARRQFGDWMPMLAVESGATSTRLRAGVEARRLIPKFLRKVVVDAYVEGMVSAEQDPNETGASAQQNSQTQAAVLLELRFPHSLIGEAQYGPGQRWSADFSWEP